MRQADGKPNRTQWNSPAKSSRSGKEAGEASAVWWKKEKEKLESLTLPQKVRYILDYYWIWILGIIFTVWVLFFVTQRLFFTPKDYWFYGMYVGTMENGGNQSPLWKDFVSYAGYDTTQKMVEMNASSWFDPSVSGGTNNSYYQAFVALVESGDLDVAVMKRAALEAVGSSGRLADLEREPWNELGERFHDRLVYCVPNDETYSDSSVAVGIDLSDSPLVTEYALYPGDCVLGISAYSKRPETVETFLNFLLGENDAAEKETDESEGER